MQFVRDGRIKILNTMLNATDNITFWMILKIWNKNFFISTMQKWLRKKIKE